MTALFWATFTFWRCITIFYIEYVGNEMNILLALVAIMIGNIILVPFANSSVVCLWIGVAIIGLGTSPVWGCVFGYLEQHFPVTSKIAASMVVSACVGEFVFPFIISYFIVSTPIVFLWLTLICSVSLIVIFFGIMFFMRKLKANM
jgi:fucose permease